MSIDLSNVVPVGEVVTWAAFGQWIGITAAVTTGNKDKMADWAFKGGAAGGLIGLATPALKAIVGGHLLMRVVP